MATAPPEAEASLCAPPAPPELPPAEEPPWDAVEVPPDPELPPWPLDPPDGDPPVLGEAPV